MDGEEGAARQEAQVDGPKGDVEMWHMVEQAMEEGTLDALRNRKEHVVRPGSKANTQLKEQKKKKSKTKPHPGIMQQMLKDGRSAANQEDEDDSDGGFFE